MNAGDTVKDGSIQLVIDTVLVSTSSSHNASTWSGVHEVLGQISGNHQVGGHMVLLDSLHNQWPMDTPTTRTVNAGG